MTRGTFPSPAGLPGDDALDRATVDHIEALHAAVMQEEAAQRFGLFRGKKSSELADAEAAEVTFLNEHGFATYTDYRLRIRRSTVVPRPSVGDGSAAAHGVAGAPVPGDDDPSGAEPGQERTEEQVHGPDRRRAEPKAEGAPSPRRPAARVAAPGDFAGIRQAYEMFFNRMRAEMDEFVHARLELAERHASEAFDAAAREAAELLSRTQVLQEGVASLTDELARRSRAVLDAADDALRQLGAAAE